MLKARLTETGSKSSSRAHSPKLPLNRVSPKEEDHELMPNLPLMRLTAPLYQPTSLNLRQPNNKYVLEILEMAQLGRCCDAILLRQAMHGDFYAVALAALELSIRNISLLPAARSDCGGHEVNQISQEGLLLETQESMYHIGVTHAFGTDERK